MSEVNRLIREKELKREQALRGELTTHTIWHGGCIRCTSQEENGMDFCFHCQYFDADWSKPDLSKKEKRRKTKVMKHTFGQPKRENPFDE
jgi:hypothetical protein